jgi:hypothetical protein
MPAGIDATTTSYTNLLTVDYTTSTDNDVAWSVYFTTTPKYSPVIVTQPEDQAVWPDEDAVFNVEATSPLEMTYQWYNSGGAIAGATSNVLTITNVSESDADSYYCVVSNADGDTTSDSAKLTIKRMMLAHYELDDDFATTSTVLDSSGNEHHGTAYNDVARVDGVIGYAASFDGKSDYINIGTWNPSDATGRFSISVWVNWAGVLPPPDRWIWQGIIAKRNLYSASGMMWELEATNGNVGFYREGSNSGVLYQLSRGVWTHIAVTFDGTTATMYANGELVGSFPFSEGSNPSANFYIGSSEGTVGGWHGYIDDVRIYDFVLSHLEVAVLYTDVMTGEHICLGYPAHDLNGDCRVGLKDLAILCNEWLQPNPAHDLNGDGQVTFEDLAILCNEWLQCNLVPDCKP